MPRNVLIQIASGEPYESMLNLTKDWHDAYCIVNKWEYSPRIQFVDPAPFSHNSMVEVFASRVLSDYSEGDVIAFLPADAIISKTTDMRECLPDGSDIALFGNTSFVNAGFMVIRNSATVQEFLSETVAMGPLEGTSEIASRICDALNTTPQIKANYLTSQWQWYDSYGAGEMEPDCLEEDAIIRAWHGGSRFEALKSMKVWMRGLLEKQAKSASETKILPAVSIEAEGRVIDG